jgi:hypothetical protein
MLTGSQGAFSMGALGQELVLFSPVTGVVVDGGKPVAGAKVTRSVKWKDSHEVDEVVTTAAGEFQFAAKSVRSMMWSLIPHNPVVMQTITIQAGDKTYEAWEYQKGNYEMNSEADGKTVDMLCDLQNEPRSHAINQLFSYWGICTLR